MKVLIYMYIVGFHYKCLKEALTMSTHNIYIYMEK